MLTKCISFSIPFLAIFFMSCRTVTHKVIERSKKEEPTWVANFKAESIKELKGGFRVIYAKKDVKDLPLGIRQGQQQAISLSHKQAFDMILDKAFKNSVNIPDEARQSLEFTGLRAVESSLEADSLVKDIYFEKLRFSRESKREDSYTIYVMCFIDRKDLESAVKRMKQTLVRSTSPQLRLLGSQLKESVL